MERAELRKLPLPEIILAGIGLLVVLFIMVRSATTDCHHWKQEITYVAGAALAAAGEEEYPQPETGINKERAALRNAAQAALDARPMGCL